MNGPIKNAKEESLQGKQDWLQRLVEIGGVVVFLGLLIEDGPELVEAISQRRFPGRGVVGGIIVALGVFVEVLFASLVTQTSKQLQVFSDARNAELHERAAKSEQHAAEANLQLANIKTPRTLAPQQQFEIMAAIKPFAGQRFTISVSADEDSLNLVEVIKGDLEAAGWLFIPTNNTIQISGKPYAIVVTTGVKIRVSIGDLNRFENVAIVLSAALRSQGIWSVLEPISDPVLDNAVNVAVGSKPLTIPQRQPPVA